MTSAARTAVSPPPCATRTRTPARASPAGHARAHPRGRARARALASALLGGLAGVAAAAAFVAVAPAVGRGAGDGLDRVASRNDAVVRDREPATPPVASVLIPAMDAGVLPAPDPAEARP